MIRERTAASTHPLYLRGGDPVPDEIDPTRIIFIKRVYVDPPEREDEVLPEAQFTRVEIGHIVMTLEG